MSFSYKKFIKRLDSKGMSLNQLRLKKVLTQHAYEAMLNDESVGIDKIDRICQHLKIPIEEVVEIKLEDEPSESESPDQ